LLKLSQIRHPDQTSSAEMAITSVRFFFLSPRRRKGRESFRTDM
jgi:hypothetical protein